MAMLRDFQNIISNAAADLEAKVFVVAGPVHYEITEVWYDVAHEKVWIEIRRPRITDAEAEEWAKAAEQIMDVVRRAEEYGVTEGHIGEIRNVLAAFAEED